ncbi:TPA: hypothetical protein EYP66_05805 [Candidatus Poribacteria bacterium]|nr:hypothetical protein [Candidatus Poribacteria bacterium]
MTPKERLLTTLRLKVPDRVPMDLTGFNREAFRLFKEKTGSDNPAEYFGAEYDYGWVGFKGSKIDPKMYARFHKNLPEGARFNEWGTAFVVGSNPAFDHFIAPLTDVKSIEEFKDYPLPDFTAEYRHKHLEEEVSRIHQQGLAAIGGMACTIFEVSWQIRGFNELLTDFLIRREYAEALLDRITELSCFRARRFAEAGVDIIHIGDDVGMEHKTMMSRDLWWEWLGSRLSKVIESARQVKPDVLFYYHSDGYVEPFIPDFINIGIDCLNPVQPECMDPAKLKQKYGDRLAFWGTIGIQTTMPFGTPEDVRREVKERIGTVGRGGGLVIGPTHAIEPEVPLENIFAFVNAVKEYGKY